MDDLLIVSVLNGMSQRLDQVGGHRGGQGLSENKMPVQTAAAYKFHGEIKTAIMFLDFVNLDDVRMVHACRGFGFDAKAGPFFGASQSPIKHKFQSYLAI